MPGFGLNMGKICIGPLEFPHHARGDIVRIPILGDGRPIMTTHLPFPLSSSRPEAGADLLHGGVELRLGLGRHLDLRRLEPLPLGLQGALLLPQPILLPAISIKLNS